MRVLALERTHANGRTNVDFFYPNAWDIRGRDSLSGNNLRGDLCGSQERCPTFRLEIDADIPGLGSGPGISFSEDWCAGNRK